MSSSSNSLFSSADLQALGDVTCSVDVWLGTATISVRDCLHMKRHMVIPLEQSAGSDMQVVINGVLVAHGEVVIIDDSTAVRVTEIATPPSAETSA
jgi:flagellar motor switch protein FliN/FliY